MDKLYLKSQTSIEFLTLTGLILFMLVLFLAVISYKVEDINLQKEIIYGEDIIIKIQKEINLASRSLDGYSRNFRLPQKLGSLDYNITIFGNELIVLTKNQAFERRIPAIIGNITKGINKINKTNEIIYLN